MDCNINPFMFRMRAIHHKSNRGNLTMSHFEKIKEAVKSGNFVILDTETTGLKFAEVLEIAIIDPQGNTLMNQRVKPYGNIEPGAIDVHGITLDDVKNEPRFNSVAGYIQTIITGKDVIVYNAKYDRHILHSSAEHAEMEKIDWKSFSTWICAMEAFSPIYGDWSTYHGNYKWKSLEVASRYYNVPVNNAHTALGDCLMTLGVVNAMAKG